MQGASCAPAKSSMCEAPDHAISSGRGARGAFLEVMDTYADLTRSSAYTNASWASNRSTEYVRASRRSALDLRTSILKSNWHPFRVGELACPGPRCRSCMARRSRLEETPLQSS